MKKLLAVLLTIACLLSMAACGSKEEKTKEEVLAEAEVYIAYTTAPEDKKLLSATDAEAILTLLFGGTWEQYAYLCNDTLVFTVSGQEVYYCYECGRFNDKVNDLNYRIYDIEHKAIKQMAESYFEAE